MFAPSKPSKNVIQRNALNGDWKYRLIKRITIITIKKYNNQ